MKVSLPDPEHSHYDVSTHRFVTHSHPHGGMHDHAEVNGRIVTIYRPGNYSPKASR